MDKRIILWIKNIFISLLNFLKRDKFACVGVLIYLVFIIIAILAPVLAPYDPLEMVKENGKVMFNQIPSVKYLLGTTNMGRDIFSQLLFGARPALIIGFSAAFIVMVVGTFIGLIAGYYRGKVGSILMRITDIAFGIPFIPFIMVLVAFLGPSIWNIVFSMAILIWRDTARVIRSQVLTLRERNFVEAAKVSGASDLRIMFFYIMPNILPLSFLYGSLTMGWAILGEAALSFLGMGAQPPMAEWGLMLSEGRAFVYSHPHLTIIPGVFLALYVLSVNLIGDGLRDTLDPRLK